MVAGLSHGKQAPSEGTGEPGWPKEFKREAGSTLKGF